MRTLFHNGDIRVGYATDDWLLMDGETIENVGSGDPPAADRRIDLEGGTVVPAFMDAHVHLPATGLYAMGMDFRGERSAAAIRAAFAERAERPDELLFGGNFEDPLDEALDRTILDDAVGARPALLARADMHSCVVSTALLDQLDVDGLDGVDRDAERRPTGYLREKAASEAWRWFENNLPRSQLKEAVARAALVAASKGVTVVNEMFVVEWRGWGALEWFREAVEDVPIHVRTYVGTVEDKRGREIGFDRIGGDFFLDGSFGSRTAWMSEPYLSPPPEGSPVNGISYRDDADVFDFFMEAQEHSMQVGVHAIGDAAIEQALSAWERVEKRAGTFNVRVMHNRIEHFECASDDHIRRAARLHIDASVQPAFDLFWGGEDGLYAQRIGWERASKMNRFKTMYDSGIELGIGSDSTVTPLDPFLQMRALRTHHLGSEQIDPVLALQLHTNGSHSLGGWPSDCGALDPDMRADLAWLDRDPVATPNEELDSISVRGTWRAGQRIWPVEDADR